MTTRDEYAARDEQIKLLEQHLISDLEPALAGRVRKLYRVLDRVIDHSGLSDNPQTIIGWRAQNLFILPELELVEEGMANIYRYARPKALNNVLQLLQTRGLTVSVHSNKRRGAIPVWRQLHTPKGRILF